MNKASKQLIKDRRGNIRYTIYTDFILIFNNINCLKQSYNYKFWCIIFLIISADQQIPWLGAGVGIILGVIVVIADYVFTNKPTLTVRAKKKYIISPRVHLLISKLLLSSL